MTRGTYRNWLSAQDEERFGSLCQESRKLVYQDVLDLVGLLDLQAYADRVDAGLDEDSLVFVSGDGQRGEEDLGGGLGLDLRDIVSLGRLGCEVGERQRSSQAATHALQVRSQRLRLQDGRGQSRSFGETGGAAGPTITARKGPSAGQCYRCRREDASGAR